MKKMVRIEASFLCRQQFANEFADCFCAVHTHTHTHTHTDQLSLPASLPTLASEGCLGDPFFVAVSRKDCELPNLRVCLAKIDIDHGLDFPLTPDLPFTFALRNFQRKKYKTVYLVSANNTK